MRVSDGGHSPLTPKCKSQSAANMKLQSSPKMYLISPEFLPVLPDSVSSLSCSAFAGLQLIIIFIINSSSDCFLSISIAHFFYEQFLRGHVSFNLLVLSH